jgi:hypothetical protein
MYRSVLGRMDIVHFKDKLITYVNTRIDPGTALNVKQIRRRIYERSSRSSRPRPGQPNS